MDIYEWAEEYFWAADYYDQKTGNRYGIIEYKQHLDENDPLEGIPVYNPDNELVGYAKKRQ